MITYPYSRPNVTTEDITAVKEAKKSIFNWGLCN